MKDVFDLSAQVPIQMSGMRFDQIASELFPDFSRSRLSSWIKDGQLKVDGRIAKPKDKLIGGEVLELKAELARLQQQYQDASFKAPASKRETPNRK
mgnify:CR=1 FL=1